MTGQARGELIPGVCRESGGDVPAKRTGCKRRTWWPWHRKSCRRSKISIPH